MSAQPANPPVDPGTSRLLELFRSALDGVRFPDIDREVLEALAGDVTTQHERIEALRAELAGAEQQLTATRSALHERAREGLAYARLYAARHPDLAEQLDAIQLDAPTKRGRKPRKPRTAKANETRSTESSAEPDSAARRPTRRTSAEPTTSLEVAG